MLYLAGGSEDSGSSPFQEEGTFQKKICKEILTKEDYY